MKFDRLHNIKIANFQKLSVLSQIRLHIPLCFVTSWLWLVIKQIIDQNKNISTRIIALELNICQKSIVDALKRTDVTFKFNRWMPHKLTIEKLLFVSAQRSKEKEHSVKNCNLWWKIGVLQQYKPWRKVVSTWAITRLGCRTFPN